MISNAAVMFLPLAFIVGYAMQRGGICAVLAARELIETGRWARFQSFLECAAWAMLGLLIADAIMVKPLQTWTWPTLLPNAAAGGVLFGAGALLNGACAFGSASRLTAGEISFAALIAGFVGGAAVAQHLMTRAETAHAALAFVMGPVFLLAVIGVCSFALWRAAGLLALGAGPRAMVARLRAPVWPPALAMFIIALANVGLILVAPNWPYTSLLVDIATGRHNGDATRVFFALFLLGGGVVGALTAGRFKLRTGTIIDWGVRSAAGAIMGVGAALIPGGNDALVLLGMPLLQPVAFVAYAAMIATIAFGFWAQRSRVSRPGARQRS